MTATAVIERLRAAAATALAGHLPEMWERVHGPGQAQVRMERASFIDAPTGVFVDLGLEPGTPTALAVTLDLPAVLHGAPTAGDDVEVTIHGIYPVRLSFDGDDLYEDDEPTVACGPARMTLPRPFDPVNPGTLTLELRPPKTQLNQYWCHVHVTTAGLRRRFRSIDVARAQLSLAHAFADGEDDLARLETAATLVPADLDALTTDELEDRLAQVGAALGDLARHGEALTVHLVGHTHIDLAWWWTWDDAQKVILRDIATVLDLMDEFPELSFVHSQAASYEVVERERPDLFARIRDRIADGRWEAATLQWVESDLHTVAGEAQARQLLEGVRYARERLGVSPSAFLAPDTFGHTTSIPQLATSAGARVFYHHRSNPGQPRWPAWWFEGADGSSVLACSTWVYSAVNVTAGWLADNAIEGCRESGLPVSLHFFGVGDHGGAPTRAALEDVRDLAGTTGLPKVVPSSISAFGEAVIASGVELPRATGETSLIFEGCYSTHVDGKRWNRENENRLLTAETMAAVAGVDVHEELGPAWKRVLFQQFHDIIGGSSIAEVYDEQARDAAAANAAADSVTARALDVLEDGLAAGTIAVTNPLAHERTDQVVVADVRGPIGTTASLRRSDGERILAQHTEAGLAFVATVGPFETAAFTLEPIAGAAATEAPLPLTMRDAGWSFACITTPAFDVEVRTDCGVVTSLHDRRAGRQLVGWGRKRSSDYTEAARPDLGLNVLQVVEQKPVGMSAWQLNEVFRETSHIAGGTTEVVEHGPLRIVLRHRATVGATSEVDERITFHRDLARIDVDLHVDWQEPSGPGIGIPMLKLASTADLDAPAAWFETPFAAVRRRGNGLEVPALRWVDVSEQGDGGYGLAVLNDGTYGHDVLGSRIRATVVRTAYEPDTRSDSGPQRAGFCIVPHAGDWRSARIPEQAAAWNQPLLGRVVGPAPSTAVRAAPLRPRLEGGTTAWITVVKREHDGRGTVVRLAEAHGHQTTAHLRGLPTGAAVWDATVVEDRTDQLVTIGDGVELTLGPWQVRTLIIDNQENR